MISVPLPTLAQIREELRGVVSAAVLADDEAVQDAWARAVWSGLAEAGDAAAGALIAALGAARALASLTAPPDPLAAELAGLSLRELEAARDRWIPRADRACAAAPDARQCRLRLVTPADPSWPVAVDDLGLHAPLALWVRGDPTVLARCEPSVALVGARAATSYGQQVAADLAAELAGDGVPVVSGAAYGIDGAAHRGALNAGGTTIALLAGGVDRPYPQGHARLLDEIAASGAVVGESPCGTTPSRFRFLLRNRLIAAMTTATVVVEAGWRSGTLNTAGHAASLGRPLGAVPGPVTSPASAGCHRILREYDGTCITSVDDVRELIGADPRARYEGGLPDRERGRVLDALSARVPRSADDVAARSGMTVDEVRSLLGLLALEGAVTQSAGRWRSCR